MMDEITTAPGNAHEPWLEALLGIARHYRLDGSEERVRVEADWRIRDQGLDEVVLHMARELGLVGVFDQLEPDMLDPWRLPMVADLGDGQVGLLEQIDADGQVVLRVSGDRGLTTSVGREEALQRIRRVLLVKPESAVPDARVD